MPCVTRWRNTSDRAKELRRGYKSHQDAYRQIWSETNLGGSESGRQGERWWGHADRIEAKKAEVSAYTEGYVKQNPLPRKTVRQIGEESDIRYSEARPWS